MTMTDGLPKRREVFRAARESRGAHADVVDQVPRDAALMVFSISAATSLGCDRKMAWLRHGPHLFRRDIDDCLYEGLRRLLRKVVAHTASDRAVGVLT